MRPLHPAITAAENDVVTPRNARLGAAGLLASFAVLAAAAAPEHAAPAASPRAVEQAEPVIADAARSMLTGSVRPRTRPWHGRLGRGSLRDYEFIAQRHGRPARWDPCDVITYRVNPGSMGVRDLIEVRRAVGKVAGASGLRFRFRGFTSYVWSRSQRYGGGPADADLTFSFARPGRGRGASDLLTRTDMVGVGGPAWRADGRSLRIVKGYVVINERVVRRLPRGNGPGARMSAYMHEIGHAVGLDHTDGRGQIMYPVLQKDVPPVFGAGDLAGLRRLGRAAGCMR